MEMKFYSPLTAEFFPDEPDWEDESYNEYEGYPMDGHDLLQYADAVDEAVKKDIADFNGDLMQYYHEDDSVRQKVISAVPSVEKTLSTTFWQRTIRQIGFDWMSWWNSCWTRSVPNAAVSVLRGTSFQQR